MKFHKQMILAIVLLLFNISCSTLPNGNDEDNISSYTNLLLNEANEYFLIGNYSKSIEYYKEAYNSFVISDNLKEKISLALQIAKIYYSSGDTVLSNKWVNIAIINGLADKKSFQKQFFLYNANKLFFEKNYAKLSTEHSNIEDLDFSIEEKLILFCEIVIAKQKLKIEYDNELERILQFYQLISEKKESFSVKSYSAFLLGIIYYNETNYNLSLEYFIKASEIDIKLKNYSGVANCFESIGNVYLELKNFDFAVFYFNKSTEFYRINNNEEDASRINAKTTKIIDENNLFNTQID